MTQTAEEAIRNAHAWFEVNSGWAPPDEDNLAEWVADGLCRCPDECIVAPDAWCDLDARRERPAGRASSLNEMADGAGKW